MSFSEVYGTVLAPFVETYQEGRNAKERKAIVVEAADAVKEAKELLEEVDDLPKDLQTVSISSHFFVFVVEM